MKHRLLLRQLRKVGITDLTVQPTTSQLEALLQRIERSYEAHDQERYQSERTLDQLSKEMQGLYEDLRANSESQIRAERDKLKVIISSIADGLATLDVDGRLTSLNPVGVKLLGIMTDDWLGEKFAGRVFLDPDSETLIERTLALGKISTVSGVRFRRGAGFFRVTLTVSPVREGNKIVGAVMAFRDTTNQWEVEENLRVARQAAEQANVLKTVFLANMSHELRTPMNAILGMTGLLLETRLNHEQRDFTETVNQAAQNLLQLLNSVLDLSKIESGQLEVIDTPLEPRIVLEEVIALFSETASSGSVEFTGHCAPDIPRWIRGDPGRLRQILTNLVSNALKFTPSGSVVVLGQRVGDTLEWSVCDTGVGIDPSQLGRLFEPFAQLDSSSTRRFGGTGLGLAICRQLVELMGGEIHAQSWPEKGSHFCFTIPLVEEEGRLPTPLLGNCILVVSPKDATRRVLVDTLTESGALVIGQSDADLARSYVQDPSRSVDLVIVDQDLKSMTGEAFLRDITEISPGCKRVLLWPHASPQERKHIATPIRWSQLLDSVTKLLGRIAPGQLEYPALTGQRRVRIEGRRPRVLVAEDNYINQRLTLRLLERLGYRGEVVENGAAAVRAFKETHFDAILMDCMMPEVDGYEASRQIRAAEPKGQRIPIIAMTANVQAGAREECLESGMDDYLSKPVDFGDFERVLALWIDARLKPELSQQRVLSVQCVDTVVLESLRGLEQVTPGFMESLVETFSAATETSLDQLRTALEARDSEAVGVATQVIRENCSPIGALEMIALCGEIELHARAGDGPSASSAFARLHGSYRRVQSLISRG